MGSILSYFMPIAPSVIYAYNQTYYDPLKGRQYKLENPRAAFYMQIPVQNKELGRFNPLWHKFFTSPVYKAAWNSTRRQVLNGSDRIELDPVIYRDWNAGGSYQWQNGQYYNENPFKGPMNMYDYINAKKRGGCPCE